MFDNLTAHRLLALFAAGWLLFNFPLLAIWDRDATLFGIPLFPFGLFVVWGLMIGAIAVVAERSPEDGAPPGPRGDEPGDG